ncbi:MAG TPA: hypothetical protein VFS22_03410 [Flavisolibacter sp.]|nr:hypothetical protein [Flavisolibacter sp.]
MRYLFALLAFVSMSAQAQWKNYIIGTKGDTLNRVDMKGLKQGPWVIHVDDLRGERGYEEEGFFENDKKEGVWRRFSLEGDMIAVENYRFGYKDGKNVYFNYQGELLREESWRAIDPQNPYDTVNVYDLQDPTKVVGKQVVKLEPNSYKHGIWKFYDPQMGTVEKTEQWVMDKPKEKEKAVAAATGDDDLAPIDPVSGEATVKKEEKKAVTKPQAVLDYEKKNAGKKKVKTRTGQTGG